MSRITTDEVRSTLAAGGWKLISEKYVNLDTPLMVECDCGHRSELTWRKLRAKLECPSCALNQVTYQEIKVVAKPKGVKRVLAFDQATYLSGWSVFDDGQLVKFGGFETRLEDEFARINTIKNWVVSMVKTWNPDIVGLEGIQLEKNYGVLTFETLARLQGVLADAMVTLGVPFKICPTNTWRAHSGVKGRTRTDKKNSMKQIVFDKWKLKVNDDCADAIGIGQYVADNLPKKVVVENWE